MVVGGLRSWEAGGAALRRARSLKGAPAACAAAACLALGGVQPASAALGDIAFESCVAQAGQS